MLPTDTSVLVSWAVPSAYFPGFTVAAASYPQGIFLAAFAESFVFASQARLRLVTGAGSSVQLMICGASSCTSVPPGGVPLNLPPVCCEFLQLLIVLQDQISVKRLNQRP